LAEKEMSEVRTENSQKSEETSQQKEMIQVRNSD
jgi:hypothetical protein